MSTSSVLVLIFGPLVLGVLVGVTDLPFRYKLILGGAFGALMGYMAGQL